MIAYYNENNHFAAQWLRNLMSDLEWLSCTDGKARPTEPGLFPLAHGAPARVGRLRAYGNAIVAQIAAQFIGAFMEC
jgi:DNA (cytosine-5)-methyltransferase 1